MAKNNHHSTANPKPTNVSAVPIKKKLSRKKILLLALVAIIAAVILLLCLPGNGSATLSEEMKNQISQDWLNSYRWHWYDEGAYVSCRYYGEFDGYKIIFRPFNSMEPLNLVIADKTFSFEYEFDLMGYKDGKLTDVSTLYKNGKVSQESINALAALHEGNSNSWPKLSMNEKNQIENAWHEANTVLLWDSGAYQKRSTRYYGTFNGYVIFLNVSAVPPESLRYYRTKIANSTFEMSCSATIYGYKDGRIYRLRDLYDGGIFNEKVVANIAKIHEEASAN